MDNLDYLAAKYAQEVIKASLHEEKSKVENAVTKTLGVLQECGVYACFVFALSKKEQPYEYIICQMQNLLKKLLPELEAEKEITLEIISEKITKDLQKTLLAKEVLEQMLIYARYGAKAREDKKS